MHASCVVLCGPAARKGVLRFGIGKRLSERARAADWHAHLGAGDGTAREAGPQPIRVSVVPVDPESMSTFVDLCTVNNVDSRSAFRP